MHRELLSLKIKYQWYHFISTVALLFSSLILLYYTNLYSWAKLSIILAMGLSLILALYQIMFSMPDKIDLLLDINNAIIWQNKRPNLYIIHSLRSVSYGITIINLIKHNKIKPLLLLPGTIPKEDYKALKRAIKWKKVLNHS